MKAGFKRLIKNLDDEVFNKDEFLEDTKLVASQNPEMADIFRRMIKTELNAIKQNKKRESKKDVEA